MGSSLALADLLQTSTTTLEPLDSVSSRVTPYLEPLPSLRLNIPATSSYDGVDCSWRPSSSSEQRHVPLAIPPQLRGLSRPPGSQKQEQQPEQLEQPVVVPQELRQNPRRSQPGRSSAPRCPPALVRQTDRRVNFVDGLVDVSTHIVEAIWPLSAVRCRPDLPSKAVLPLRTFIQETLRRSRTSYSTLQVALYYLILLKHHVPRHIFLMEASGKRFTDHDRLLQCGRRMFLAALILASKYLQDRNFSARAWSTISGLSTQELNRNEIAFVTAVHWKLHITDETFRRWTAVVHKLKPPPSPPPSSDQRLLAMIEPTMARPPPCELGHIILHLHPDMTNAEPLMLRNIVAFDLPIRDGSCHESIDCRPPIKTFGLELAPRRPSLSSFSAVDRPADPVMPPSVRHAPALSPCLTPRPTPHLLHPRSGFSTPAVIADSAILKKDNIDVFDTGLASRTSRGSVQRLDLGADATRASREQGFISLPPCAASISGASMTSSPESMVSDFSRTSRSSSISSASSTASASLNTLLVASSRSRSATLLNEKSSQKAMKSPVLDPYTGPIGSLGDVDSRTSSAGKPNVQEASQDSESDAAQALQELRDFPRYANNANLTLMTSDAPFPAASYVSNLVTSEVPSLARTSAKRNIALLSVDNYLCGFFAAPDYGSRSHDSDEYASAYPGKRKRLRCAVTAA